MNENQREPGRFARFFEEKGFYIILFLCVAAIGIAGYVLLLEPNETASVLSADSAPAESAPVGTVSADGASGLSAGLVRPGREVGNLPAVPTETAVPPAETAARAGTSAEETAADSPAPPEPAETVRDRDTVIREAAAVLAESRPSEETEPAAETAGEPDLPPDFFVKPVSGEVIRTFSGDELVYDRTMGDWRTHNGVDFLAADGALVTAVADGVVEDVYRDDYYGTGILVDHGGGLKSVYLGLMENAAVQEGQSVSAGDVIGAVSASSLFESLEQVHLHLEMTMNGRRVDPLDYISV